MINLKPLTPTDEFPLWEFENGVITRGRTIEEAAHYVRQYNSTPLNSVRIDAARLYSTNHRSGWLKTPMFWLCEALGLDPYAHGHLTPEQRMVEIRNQVMELLDKGVDTFKRPN